MLLIYDMGGDFGVDVRREFADGVASDLWGCAIVHNSTGAPFLGGLGADNFPRISISHTSRYWAIFSGEKPVGLDIELTARKCGHLTSKFATDAEISVASGVFDQNPALLVWCMKEAVYKAAGRVELDFLGGITLVCAGPDSLLARVTGGELIQLKWHVNTDFSNDLLVVHTL